MGTELSGKVADGEREGKREEREGKRVGYNRASSVLLLVLSPAPVKKHSSNGRLKVPSVLPQGCSEDTGFPRLQRY